MDLSDRLVEHDHWHTARLLEQAATLSDDALDRTSGPGWSFTTSRAPNLT